MKKLVALLLCIAMMLVGAVIASAEETQTYAIITKSAGNPYNEREASGFQEVVEAAGYTCIVRHRGTVCQEVFASFSKLNF